MKKYTALNIDLWQKILVILSKEPSQSMFSLANVLGASYKHVFGIFKVLELRGLITCTKIARKKVIVVTPLGLEAAKHIDELINLKILGEV